MNDLILGSSDNLRLFFLPFPGLIRGTTQFLKFV
jgi:hypothetical protein